MLLLLALFLSIGLQQTALAQAISTVTGQVLDDLGEGIPGVSVQVKGTHTGAITDVDGNFSLQLPEGHDVLVIKSSGFESQEVKVSNTGQALSIKMKPTKSSIGEISVYGQKIDPRTNTGSVTTITEKDIERKPITNIVKALDGVAGIQVTSGGGQPGSDPQMQVRGFGSLSASGSPLIVVDGVIYNGSYSSINPSDVASMSLLKDATASSLYGARGANGVLLITMKKGSKSDKPKINIDAQNGFVTNFLPPMETLDQASYYKMSFTMWRNYLYDNGVITKDQELNDSWMQTYWDAIIGGTGYNSYDMPAMDLLDRVTGDVNPNAKLLYDEPWLPELQRTGFRQVYNVSTSNGNDNSNYYFSLGYNNDQGIVKYSNFERVTSRLSVNANITSWLKTGLDINGTYENQRHFVSDPNAFINPFFTAQMVAPIYPVHLHDEQGNLVYGPDGEPLYDLGINPQYNQNQRPMTPNGNLVAALQRDDRTNKNYTFRGITYLEGKFLKDFTARVDYTLEYFSLNGNAYQNMEFGDAAASGGRVQQENTNQTDYTFRQRLVWEPSFGPFASGDHSLQLTLAHENYLLNNHTISFRRTGFTDPIFRQGAAAAVNEGSTGFIDQLATESYLAVARYDFHKKYFLSGSFRRDGSSRFSSTARWGNFWSVGGGWMISQENFMSGTSNWLSELKLKASYGVQGNENLGTNYYAWMPSYIFQPNASAPGYRFYTYGNPELHWEGSYMFDAGFDFGFLNGRINGSLDFYEKGSNDLLFFRPFAPSVGIGGISDNVGSMKNTGLELVVNADIIRTKDFTWNARLNLQHFKNKVTEMQRSDSDAIYSAATIMKKGLAYGTFFLPRYAGTDPDNGAELWYAGDSTTSDYTIARRPENKEIMGTPWRDLEGSLVNTFTYKNISLSFQLNFGIGGKFYDNNYARLMAPDNALSGQNWSPDILDSWTPENPDASLPKVTIGDPYIGSPSDRFLMSASFLKIQNINLSYSLPERWLKAANFNSASIFVAADNVYLFSARKGVDVQSSFFGVSSLSYYPYRTVMFGVKLGL